MSAIAVKLRFSNVKGNSKISPANMLFYENFVMAFYFFTDPVAEVIDGRPRFEILKMRDTITIGCAKAGYGCGGPLHTAKNIRPKMFPALGIMCVPNFFQQ